MKGEVKFLEFRAGTPRPVRQCDITDYDVFFFQILAVMFSKSYY